MHASATSDMASAYGYGRFQAVTLVVLRILIGWHFFYEGLAKLSNPYWTSAGYLDQSQWWFKGLFVALATNPSLLTFVDFVNAWGLTLIGLALMMGLLTRASTIAGAALLFLYYIAAPPFAGYVYAMPAEGSYLVVNKVLIEMVALLVLLAFPTGKVFGLDVLVPWNRGAGPNATERAHA